MFPKIKKVIPLAEHILLIIFDKGQKFLPFFVFLHYQKLILFAAFFHGLHAAGGVDRMSAVLLEFEQAFIGSST